MAGVLAAVLCWAAAASAAPVAASPDPPLTTGCRSKKLDGGAITTCPKTLAVESDVAPMTKEQTTRQLERYASQFKGTQVDRTAYRLDGRSLRSIAVRGQGAKGPYSARMVVVPRGARTRLVTCTQEQDAQTSGLCGPLLERLVRAALRPAARKQEP